MYEDLKEFEPRCLKCRQKRKILARGFCQRCYHNIRKKRVDVREKANRYEAIRREKRKAENIELFYQKQRAASKKYYDSEKGQQRNTKRRVRGDWRNKRLKKSTSPTFTGKMQ